MKAWKGTVGDGDDLGWVVLWAETRTKARVAVVDEFSAVDYIDIRVIRVPKLDGEPQTLTREVYLMAGLYDEEGWDDD